MIKKNDIIHLEISDVTGQGSGIARYEGMAVFVPMTAVGDKINARILKVKKNYAFAKIEEITEPSNTRVSQECSCYAKCGGCVFRHISYEEELKIKSRRVYDALTRIGKLSGFEMHDIVGCNSPDRYRNKAMIPVGRGKTGEIQMGFYGSHSHRITGTGECLLQPESFDKAVGLFRQWLEKYNISVYDEEAHSGLVRHLYLRQTRGGDMMICPIINGDTLPHSDELIALLTENLPCVGSVVLNINKEKTNVILGRSCRTLYGSDAITDTLCSLEFDISPQSFYQVNHDQTERLYGLAADYAALQGNELLVDLYCGAGTIGLSMAKYAKKVIGVEIIPEAIENAVENAGRNNISNAEFICADASSAAQELVKRGTHPDVVIIDPPRKGCSSDVIDAVCVMSPKRVVYVSCDPETLARDLELFTKQGYSVKDVTPVDMFPRTGHVECVVLMTKLSNHILNED